ncbi:ATP-binding protein [Rhizobium ruizarguesonis]|uniref:ATP-binding protein n=1 Tax=Rhizobium ruizarguesonis TaxID=2081791 RepID=UPI00163AA29E|nr:AAA family ATPase [Rhizobium ruizarguesonis]MBC2802386.1 ATP-binding protein [Rhizobium ruizarguesonis]
MRASRFHAVDVRADAHAADSYLSKCIVRIERLLRARALLWQATLAQFKPDHLWGVPQIPHGEVNALLARPPIGISPTEPLPDLVKLELEAAAGMKADLAALRGSAGESRLRSWEQAFALTPAERDLLILAALPELDPRYRRLLGYLMDDAALTWPSAEFASACLLPVHDNIGKCLNPDAVLLSSGQLESTPPPSGMSGPRAQRGLKACAEFLGWLRGSDGIDREILPEVELIRSTAKPPAWTPQNLLSVGRLIGEIPELMFCAHGQGAADPYQFRLLAQAANRPLLYCPPIVALDDGKLRASARSARLHGAILHLQLPPVTEGAGSPAGLGMILARHRGPLVLTTAGRPQPTEVAQRPVLELALQRPDFDQRAAFWTAQLEGRKLASAERQTLARTLADRYRLGYSEIEKAVAHAETAARLRAPRDPKIAESDLISGVRRQTASGQVDLARRILPEQVAMDLDDLILSSATRRRLAELAQRLGQRRRVLSASGLAERLPLGHGTVALFTGPTGTGKTIAAVLIAKRLGLDLFKADLGSLVSKYVGETEQRLDRLFGAAEGSDAMLFFDEADALFGRRGEVKEARDRWANLETNYLLQRIEEFEGIVILSTNLRQNIDEAFMRRIDVAIDFPMPDAALRSKLWQSLIPSGVDRPPDADLDRLAAALPLAGGHIKSIVVDAVHRAFSAQGAGDARPRLTLRQLVESAARTYEKLGRSITSAELAAEWHGWLRELEGGA